MKAGRVVLLPIAAILAITAFGCSKGSAPTDPTNNVADTSPPATPVGVHGGASVGGYSLIWDPSPSPNVSGYQVYQYSPDPATTNSYVQVGSTDAGTTSWPFPSTMYGSTWHMRVRAINPAGNASGLSTDAMIQVPDANVAGGGHPGGRLPMDH